MVRKGKILIIDDEPDFMEAFRMTMEAKSYHVVSISEKAKVEEMMKSEPDIVILGTMAPAGTSG